MVAALRVLHTGSYLLDIGTTSTLSVLHHVSMMLKMPDAGRNDSTSTPHRVTHAVGGMMKEIVITTTAESSSRYGKFVVAISKFGTIARTSVCQNHSLNGRGQFRLIPLWNIVNGVRGLWQRRQKNGCVSLTWDQPIVRWMFVSAKVREGRGSYWRWGGG